MNADSQTWKNLANTIISSMTNIKSESEFYEVSFIDLCTWHYASQLFKSINDDERFVVNEIAEKAPLTGKTPQYVIVLQDISNEVWTNI